MKGDALGSSQIPHNGLFRQSLDEPQTGCHKGVPALGHVAFSRFLPVPAFCGWVIFH